MFFRRFSCFSEGWCLPGLMCFSERFCVFQTVFMCFLKYFRKFPRFSEGFHVFRILICTVYLHFFSESRCISCVFQKVFMCFQKVFMCFQKVFMCFSEGFHVFFRRSSCFFRRFLCVFQKVRVFMASLNTAANPFHIFQKVLMFSRRFSYFSDGFQILHIHTTQSTKLITVCPKSSNFSNKGTVRPGPRQSMGIKTFFSVFFSESGCIYGVSEHDGEPVFQKVPMFFRRFSCFQNINMYHIYIFFRKSMYLWPHKALCNITFRRFPCFFTYFRRFSCVFHVFFQKVGVFMASLNTTANPFLYAMFMPAYRNAVAQTFCPCRVEKSGKKGDNTSNNTSNSNVTTTSTA